MTDTIKISRELRPVLSMILNALDRDAAEGKAARGEMAAELRALLATPPADAADMGGQAGEEVEVVAHLMRPDFMEPYVSIRRDCSGVFVEQLMTVAQHQRILAAQQRTQSAGVPDGWKLVPVALTEKMYAKCHLATRVTAQVWSDLLAAAPAQPAAHDQGEVQRLREALEEIADPIKFMRARLEDGEQLNGVYAIQMAESGSYLREIAKRAIAASTGQEVEK